MLYRQGYIVLYLTTLSNLNVVYCLRLSYSLYENLKKKIRNSFREKNTNDMSAFRVNRILLNFSCRFLFNKIVSLFSSIYKSFDSCFFLISFSITLFISSLTSFELVVMSCWIVINLLNEQTSKRL